jgi:uncharacterized protein (TIGR02246 family)
MPDDHALETRLRRLEDLLEIHQLFIDYGRHLDRGDFGAFAELFSKDGEIRLGPVGSAHGRAEIRSTMEAALADRVGETVHIISSPAVVLDGDSANAEVMWSVLARTEEGTVALTMAGRHVDELVREDGRWRILRRKGLVDLPDSGRQRR